MEKNMTGRLIRLVLHLRIGAFALMVGAHAAEESDVRNPRFSPDGKSRNTI